MKKTNPTGGFFVVFLLLLTATLVWFFNAAEEYYSYATATIDGASRVAPLNKESMLARVAPAATSFDNEVKYRKFFITFPGAQKVELQADFNRWGKDPIVLTPYKKGYFETSVALARGEYRYVFAVDGKYVPDPSNQDRQKLADGREVCIKTVR